MKKLFFILFILPVWCFAQTNITPQFKRNIPADSLLGYSIPGITGNHWLPDTSWVKKHAGGITSFKTRTGAVVPLAGDYSNITETLTNKTISGSANILSNIGNSSLTNSTISGVALGNSLFAHTPGAGIIGSNYDGHNPQTWTIDSSLMATKYYASVVVGADGIVTGMSPTTISGTTATTPSGTYRLNNLLITKGSSTNTTIDAQDASQNRYDLIVGDASGVLSLVSGVLNTDAVQPDVPANKALIASIYIPSIASGGTVTNSGGGGKGTTSNALNGGYGIIPFTFNGSTSGIKVVTDTAKVQTVSNFFPKGDTRYQKTITLTTTGSNGPATLVGQTLNIPQYSGATGANPTATAGASFVNGSATTFMRSDAAPKVDSATFQTVANFFPKGDTRYYKSSNPSNYIALTALSATSPIFYNSSTGVISSQAASASQNGYLTSTDWSTFNGKQGALTLTTTGTGGAATLIGNTLNIPNYGATIVNSVSNSDGTLTVSPTTGAVIGSLNLANANTWTAIQSYQSNNIITTPTDALTIINNTSSTSGVPNQYAPAIHWKTHVWNTTAVAADNQADWENYITTTSGSIPTSTMIWRASTSATGTPSYVNAMTLRGSDGFLNVSGNISGQSVTVNGNLLTQNTINGLGYNLYVPFANDAGSISNVGYLFAGASQISSRFGIFGSNNTTLAVGNSYASFVVGNNIFKMAASGTHAWAVNEAITPLGTITTNGSTTITNTASLYIGGASSAGTNNYALYVAGGNVNLQGLTASAPVQTDANKNLLSSPVGQTTLVAGTAAITISGVTTGSRAFVTLVSQGGTVTTTVAYAAVCTSNTLTITALTNAGATDTTDTSVLNYFVVL